MDRDTPITTEKKILLRVGDTVRLDGMSGRDFEVVGLLDDSLVVKAKASEKDTPLSNLEKSKLYKVSGIAFTFV